MVYSMLITCISYFTMLAAACCVTATAQPDQISELVQVIMVLPDGACRVHSTLVHDTEIEMKVIAQYEQENSTPSLGESSYWTSIFIPPVAWKRPWRVPEAVPTW